MDYTLIYETVHGSRAYDLHGPESDTDLKGVMIGPGRWYHGFAGGPEQVELDGGDHVRFEIRKFFRLAAKCNPTLIEVLWTDPEHHRCVTPAGELLLAARGDFLSRRAQGSFAGYALSQLKRIKTHRRWLLSPPQVEPTRAAYGLPQNTLVPRDQLGAAEAMLERGGLQAMDLSENFLEILRRERAYRGARQEWEQYRSWKKNRNPRRAAQEATFGYDCKHGCHLIRLLRMGREILQSGEVVVRRPDREELLEIKRGAWSYERLIEHAESLHAEVQAVAGTSPLPQAPDEAALDQRCVQIVERVLRGG